MHREVVEDFAQVAGNLNECLSQLQELVELAASSRQEDNTVPPQVTLAKQIFDEIVHSRTPYVEVSGDNDVTTSGFRELSVEDHDIYSQCIEVFRVFFKTYTTQALASLPCAAVSESSATPRTHADNDDDCTDDA